MDEYDDFRYDDYASLQKEYKYEEVKDPSAVLSNFCIRWSAHNDSIFTGRKWYLQNDTKPWNSFQCLFCVRALDISPGFKMMNYTFESSFQGNVQALQLSSFATFDFKPVLYFIPDNVHVTADAGLTYNVGYDLNQSTETYPNVEAQNITGSETYNGIGFSFGASAATGCPISPLLSNSFSLQMLFPKRLHLWISPVFANLVFQL